MIELFDGFGMALQQQPAPRVSLSSCSHRISLAAKSKFESLVLPLHESSDFSCDRPFFTGFLHPAGETTRHEHLRQRWEFQTNNRP